MPTTYIYVFKWFKVSKKTRKTSEVCKKPVLQNKTGGCYSRHLVEKRIAQKNTVKDITSNSQVNSYFPFRWSPARLTFNISFYLFLYLYITRITINNSTLYLKSPKNQNRRAAFGRPATKLLGLSTTCSLRSTNPRPYFCLGSQDT